MTTSMATIACPELPRVLAQHNTGQASYLKGLSDLAAPLLEVHSASPEPPNINWLLYALVPDRALQEALFECEAVSFTTQANSDGTKTLVATLPDAEADGVSLGYSLGTYTYSVDPECSDASISGLLAASQSFKAEMGDWMDLSNLFAVEPSHCSVSYNCSGSTTLCQALNISNGLLQLDQGRLSDSDLEGLTDTTQEVTIEAQIGFDQLIKDEVTFKLELTEQASNDIGGIREARRLQTCAEATIVKANQDDQEFTITDSQVQYDFYPFTTINPTGCTVLYDIDAAGADVALEFDPVLNKFKWQYTADLGFINDASPGVPGDFTDYIVTVTGTNLNGNLPTFTTFSLRIKNPCVDKNYVQVSTSPLPTNEQYQLYDSAERFTHNAFSISTTPITHSLCGDLGYEATFENEVMTTSSNPMRHFSNLRQFYIYSQDFSLVGDRQITLKAFLATYPVNDSPSVATTIEILDPCLTPTITPAPTNPATFAPYLYYSDARPSFVLTFSAPFSWTVSPSVCEINFGCSSSIPNAPQCNYDDGRNVVTFDASTGAVTATIYDMSIFPAGFYVIFITGTRNASQGLSQQYFFLQDPCPTTQLTITDPAPFSTKDYYLRDSSLVVTYDPLDFIEKATVVDCGTLRLSFINEDGSAFDTALFAEDQLNYSFSVLPTQELTVTGEYGFRWIAFYENYSANTVEQTNPWTVSIIDPCLSPRSLIPPASLTNYIFAYTITADEVSFTFDAFFEDPNWCESSLVYEVDDPLGDLVVSSFDAETRTFTFEYGTDLVPIGDDLTVPYTDYKVAITSSIGIVSPLTSIGRFTLRVWNPCNSESGVPTSQRPSWCPAEDSDFWMPIMPPWMQALEDIVIYQGDSTIINFGLPVNRYDQPVDVTVSLGSALAFSFYDKSFNRLLIDGKEIEDWYIGYHRLQVSAIETRNGRSYTYRRIFYLIAEQRPDTIVPETPDVPRPPQPQIKALTKYQLIKEEPRAGRPLPYVVGLDSRGVATIGWTKRLVLPESTHKEIESTEIFILGEPTLSSRRLQQTEASQMPDSQVNYRVVPVNMTQAEFNELAIQIVELNALEFELIDENGDVIDEDVDWSILEYTRDTLQVQLEFPEPETLSSDAFGKERVRMTFWGTEFFADEQGLQVPLGTELIWDVQRQMRLTEVASIELAILVQRVVLFVAVLFALLLVLSCGSLLPVWMFINTLQLIAHVPLIHAKLPGNAHYFLLDQLNLLRFNLTPVNTWLQQFAGRDKAYDAALVAEDSRAPLYTSLVHGADYDFNFLPNLVVVFALLALTALVWLGVKLRDTYKTYRAKKEGQEAGTLYAPWMTNFTVRLLYEAFFEIVLCVLLNLTYIDRNQKGGSGTVLRWVICFVLTLLLVVVVALTTRLVFKGGPYLADSYQIKTFWWSLWGPRFVDAEFLQEVTEADQKHHQKQLESPVRNEPKYPVSQIQLASPDEEMYGNPTPSKTLIEVPEEQLMEGNLLTAREIEVDLPKYPHLSSADRKSVRFDLDDSRELDLDAVRDFIGDAHSKNEGELQHDSVSRSQAEMERGAHDETEAVAANKLSKSPDLRSQRKKARAEPMSDQTYAESDQPRGNVIQSLSPNTMRSVAESQPLGHALSPPRKSHFEGGELIERPDTERQLLTSLADSKPTEEDALKEIQDLMSKEARKRLAAESLVEVSPHYQTLFLGLKRNQEHRATILMPLAFLLRRISYALIVLFMTSVPLVAAALLSLTCLLTVAFVATEDPWLDPQITKQHLFNEGAFYLVLMLTLICAMPLSPAFLAPLGWSLITITVLTAIYNTYLIADSLVQHLKLRMRRQKSSLQVRSAAIAAQIAKKSAQEQVFDSNNQNERLPQLGAEQKAMEVIQEDDQEDSSHKGSQESDQDDVSVQMSVADEKDPVRFLQMATSSADGDQKSDGLLGALIQKKEVSRTQKSRQSRGAINDCDVSSHPSEQPSSFLEHQPETDSSPAKVPMLSSMQAMNIPVKLMPLEQADSEEQLQAESVIGVKEGENGTTITPIGEVNDEERKSRTGVQQSSAILDLSAQPTMREKATVAGAMIKGISHKEPQPQVFVGSAARERRTDCFTKSPQNEITEASMRSKGALPLKPELMNPKFEDSATMGEENQTPTVGKGQAQTPQNIDEQVTVAIKQEATGSRESESSEGPRETQSNDEDGDVDADADEDQLQTEVVMPRDKSTKAMPQSKPNSLPIEPTPQRAHMADGEVAERPQSEHQISQVIRVSTPQEALHISARVDDSSESTVKIVQAEGHNPNQPQPLFRRDSQSNHGSIHDQVAPEASEQEQQPEVGAIETPYHKQPRIQRINEAHFTPDSLKTDERFKLSSKLVVLEPASQDPTLIISANQVERHLAEDTQVLIDQTLITKQGSSSSLAPSTKFLHGIKPLQQQPSMHQLSSILVENYAGEEHNSILIANQVEADESRLHKSRVEVPASRADSKSDNQGHPSAERRSRHKSHVVTSAEQSAIMLGTESGQSNHDDKRSPPQAPSERKQVIKTQRTAAPSISNKNEKHAPSLKNVNGVNKLKTQHSKTLSVRNPIIKSLGQRNIYRSPDVVVERNPAANRSVQSQVRSDTHSVKMSAVQIRNAAMREVNNSRHQPAPKSMRIEQMEKNSHELRSQLSQKRMAEMRSQDSGFDQRRDSLPSIVSGERYTEESQENSLGRAAPHNAAAGERYPGDFNNSAYIEERNAGFIKRFKSVEEERNQQVPLTEAAQVNKRTIIDKRRKTELHGGAGGHQSQRDSEHRASEGNQMVFVGGDSGLGNDSLESQRLSQKKQDNLKNLGELISMQEQRQERAERNSNLHQESSVFSGISSNMVAANAEAKLPPLEPRKPSKAPPSHKKSSRRRQYKPSAAILDRVQLLKQSTASLQPNHSQWIQEMKNKLEGASSMDRLSSPDEPHRQVMSEFGTYTNMNSALPSVEPHNGLKSQNVVLKTTANLKMPVSSSREDLREGDYSFLSPQVVGRQHAESVHTGVGQGLSQQMTLTHQPQNNFAVRDVNKHASYISPNPHAPLGGPNRGVGVNNEKWDNKGLAPSYSTSVLNKGLGRGSKAQYYDYMANQSQKSTSVAAQAAARLEKSANDSREEYLAPNMRMHAQGLLSPGTTLNNMDLRSQASSKAHEIDYLGNFLSGQKLRDPLVVQASLGTDPSQNPILVHHQQTHRPGNSSSLTTDKQFNRGQTLAGQSARHSSISASKRAKDSRRNASQDERNGSLPEIKESQQVATVSSKQTLKSKKSGLKRKVSKLEAGSHSARLVSEDPYENHRFFVNNKASRSVIKLIMGSYAQPGADGPAAQGSSHGAGGSTQRRTGSMGAALDRKSILQQYSTVVGSSASNVRDMMSHQQQTAHGAGGPSCQDKQYYRCSSQRETAEGAEGGPANDGSSFNTSTSIVREHSIDVQDLRYNNKTGFKDGLLFPIAKTTNPPLINIKKKSSTRIDSRLSSQQTSPRKKQPTRETSLNKTPY